MAKKEKLPEGVRRGKGGALENIVPAAGERLAAWLNSSPPQDELERVTALLEDCLAMRANRADEERFWSGGQTRSGVTRRSDTEAIRQYEKAYRDEHFALGASISQRLSAYIGWFVFHGCRGGKFDFSFVPDSRTPPEEWNALLDLTDLARAGKIHHLRRCERCRAWMYVPLPEGKRPMKYCKTCRPIARMEYLATYMKEYRKLPPVRRRKKRRK